MIKEITIEVHGETLMIHMQSGMWISPCNGQQHVSDRSAMRAELRRYYRDSGDDVDDDEIQDKIERLLDQVAN